MRVGCPKEIKNHEYRVGLTPASVREYVAHGHEVWIETKAGSGIGADDHAYIAAGAKIAASAKDIFERCDMIVKVKEPQPSEWVQLREGQLLYTYLHLAPDPEQTKGLLASGVTAVAYETLEVGRTLPLLTPMSEVAGRMAIQEGAKYLEKPQGGLGILLGGVPGVKRARVLVLGGGIVGMNAARMACGLGADVTIMDVNLDRLRYLDEVMPRNCRTVFSTPFAVREHLVHADLVIGAILIPGAAAPKLVRRADLALMKKGSVIIDVAVDQGGCVETIHPTTHADPVYEVDGVIHYGVANMPGAVPQTSTMALTNATLAYTLQLARLGAGRAIRESEPLATAANVIAGKITCKGVADAFGMEYVPPRVAAESLRA